MVTRFLILTILLAACGSGNAEDSPGTGSGQAPAAALVPMRGEVALDQALMNIERELLLGLRDQDEMDRHLERAEAITDRLLETQMPFAWVNSRSYGVEPMLRQIQALADRIVAERRNNSPRESIRRDLTDLRLLVRRLRLGIRAGGGPQPPSLDSLLARYAADTLDVPTTTTTQ
jgi:hypothetical protein